jgi:hypothetical protein
MITWSLFLITLLLTVIAANEPLSKTTTIVNGSGLLYRPQLASSAEGAEESYLPCP